MLPLYAPGLISGIGRVILSMSFTGEIAHSPLVSSVRKANDCAGVNRSVLSLCSIRSCVHHGRYEARIIHQRVKGGGMQSLTYLCTQCGALRRSSFAPVWRAGTQYAFRIHIPEHCGRPMKELTYPQAVAATHADSAQRVEWAKHGLSIYRRGGQRGGKKQQRNHKSEEQKQRLRDAALALAEATIRACRARRCHFCTLNKAPA